MKKIIFLIIMVSVSFIVRGQNYVDKGYKDNVKSEACIYKDSKLIAKKSITLKPGFKVVKGTSFKASILKRDIQEHSSMPNEKSFDIEYVPFKGVGSIMNLGTTEDNTLTSIKYYDNFGNVEQSHIIKAAPDGRDLVSFSEFTPGATTEKSYLGFAMNTDGVFVNDVKSVQREFYASDNGIATDNKPWAVTTVENSPERRVLNSTGVGEDFTNHSASTNVAFNSVADEVPMFEFNGTNWVYRGYYQANTHFVSRTIDENGKEAVTVTNSLGQTVKTKSGDIENWYIYDDLGRMVHTIPVAAVGIIKMSGVGYVIEFSGTPLNEYIYSYKYADNVTGVAEKYLPGINGTVEYVYDKYGRVMLSRNQKLKSQNRWSFIKYDQLGRVIITGSYKAKGNYTREQLQQLVLNSNAKFFEVVDPVDYQVLALQDQANGTKTDKHTVYYSSNVFPAKSFTSYVESIQYDVITIYDKYHIPELQFRSRDGYDDYMAKPTGQITSKAVRVENGIKAGTYNKSAFYYNTKGQLISTVSTSIFNEDVLNRTFLKYDFIGKAEKSLSLYNRKLKSGGFNQMEISQYHTYDRMGRLLKVDQQISGDANGRVTMAEYEYNVLGQTETRKLHKKADGAFLQTVDYAYNIRGQVTDINSVDDKNSDDVFAMHINYNKQLANSEVTAKSLWNGFISSVEWRSGEGKKQAYAFEYDDNYRLTDAKYAAGDNLNEDLGRFNMQAEYDNMGNITRMQRNGGANGALIDDLTYTYVAEDGTKGNKLYSVTDASTNSFKDQYGFGKRDASFVYDDLGNLMSDSSRDVYSIKYNNQNLPVKVVLSDGKEVLYEYTAEGIKLTRTVYNPYTMKSIYTRYEGGFVYETDLATNKLDLKYFAHSQGGRVVVNDNRFSYEYFISDHLGNVRATIGSDESGNLALLQTTDYYPFGLTMANGNKANADQPYQYGGKEWQNSTQVYDFHARQYNPALGRWFNIDPMLEKFSGTSTYNYCLNNPINVIDPDGRESVLPEKPWNWNEDVHGTWGTMSSLRQAGYDPWVAMNMAMEHKMSLARKEASGGGSSSGRSSDGEVGLLQALWDLTPDGKNATFYPLSDDWSTFFKIGWHYVKHQSSINACVEEKEQFKANYRPNKVNFEKFKWNDLLDWMTLLIDSDFYKPFSNNRYNAIDLFDITSLPGSHIHTGSMGGGNSYGLSINFRDGNYVGFWIVDRDFDMVARSKVGNITDIRSYEVGENRHGTMMYRIAGLNNTKFVFTLTFYNKEFYEKIKRRIFKTGN
ncbi:MAG: DUF6443 domain-containing protein [Bacteroidales bacterium]|jgi:RHS repeat-associated protein|nr:DUF6443 domain-containing protein [Bacteroidales bacterium]